MNPARQRPHLRRAEHGRDVECVEENLVDTVIVAAVLHTISAQQGGRSGREGGTAVMVAAVLVAVTTVGGGKAVAMLPRPPLRGYDEG